LTKIKKVGFIYYLHRNSDSESFDAFTVNFLNNFISLIYCKTKDEVLMVKNAEILVSLVNESAEKSNDEIEKEIFVELQKSPQVIPWIEKVLMVRVNEG
jgi:hypothetical protein